MPSLYSNPDNIFLQARLKAAQEIDNRLANRLFAARSLNCSIDSLKDYESGRRFPPEEMVIKMALDIYKSPDLLFSAFDQSTYGRALKRLGIELKRECPPPGAPEDGQ